MDEAGLRALTNMTALEHRFWAKVAIVDDDSSCWEWTASRHPEGYGMFQMGRASTGAHRVSLMLTTGTIPEVACHHCDNRACVRPSHIYDGTHATNMADKSARGRVRTGNQAGEANPNSLLTDAIVIDARERARAGETHKSIAESQGLPRPALTLAISGGSWKHLDGVSPPVVAKSTITKIPREEHAAIRRARQDGIPIKVLAEQYGVTGSLISKIANGVTS